MEISEIITFWTDRGYPPYRYSITQLTNPGLNKDTIDFLQTCGLPSDSAPCLSFYNLADSPLATVKDMFNIDMPELDDYLMMGFNGCGDPVCIDLLRDNEIVYLNHDNDFERVFINKDIRKFIQCLRRFTIFIEITNSTDSSNFIEERFDRSEIEKLKQDLLAIDAFCMHSDAMWGTEIAVL